MDLIKWDSLLPKNLFEDFPSIDMTGWDLAMDVYEQDGNLIVEMQVPGVEADSYDVSIKDGKLHVNGSRDKKTEIEDQNYYRKEIHRGHFERTVTLPPGDFKEDEIHVSHENGTIKISIPKA